MALETMQGNWTSSRGEGGNLMFFLKLSGNLGFPLELNRGCSFNTHVFSAKSGCLSSFQGHLGIILELWQGSRDTPRVEEGDPGSPFQLPLGYSNSYRFSRGVRHCLLLNHAAPHFSGDVKSV